MATSFDLLPAENTVARLIAFIATPGVTSSAIKDFFAPYCDCIMPDWIIEAIDDNDQPVLNKLRELLAADPYTALATIIRDKPAGKLMERFCDDEVLKGRAWSSQGTLTAFTIADTHPNCVPVFNGVYIQDTLQFNDSMNQPIEGRNLQIGQNFYPKPADPDADPLLFKNYIFNVDGLGIIEDQTDSNYSGSWVEGWAQSLLLPNRTPIPTNDIEMGFSVNVTELNGRGDWPGFIALGLASEIALKQAADATADEWPYYKWDADNPITSYQRDFYTPVSIGLFFRTTYNELTNSFEQSLEVMGPIPLSGSAQSLWSYDKNEFDTQWNSLPQEERQKYDLGVTSPGFPAGEDGKWFRQNWYDEDGNVRGRRMDFKVITKGGYLYVYLNKIQIFNIGYKDESTLRPAYGWRCAMGAVCGVGYDKRRENQTDLKDFNLFDYYVKAFNGTPPL